MSGRGFKTNRSRRGGHRKNQNNDDNDTPTKKERPPPGLKGKEIGLFYAKRSQLRKRQRLQLKPLGAIVLSEPTKQHIIRILNNCSLEVLNTCPDKDKLYRNIRHSEFKQNFLSIVYGNIMDTLTSASSAITRKPDLDEKLYEEFQAKKSSTFYQFLLEKRQKLPSFANRETLLKVIEENQVVVISGETGCGKTTQVAQFILDHYIENKKGSVCRIVCTQPRRISAISVAERVAHERGEIIGESVGYQIRMERKMPRERGSISFCTTGIILKQMETDPSLGNISHVILDEIHERDVMSDFLIALLKQVVTKRKDFKVILMSATLNSEAFSRYYDDCPHVNIPGFTYPVAEYFLEDVLQRTKFRFPFENKFTKGKERQFKYRKNNLVQKNADDFRMYIEPHARELRSSGRYDAQVCSDLMNAKSEEINLDLIYELLLDICTKEKQGAVLIFLTGFAEISKLNDKMESSGRFPPSRYIIIPLHSMMPTVQQKEIFNPAPAGKRKIVISTNIAETSITIDDVVYVIDCGKIKVSNFDVEMNTKTLTAEWVSLANANQRKGRAGRVQPGVCFHLFSRARHMILESFQKPEILRVPLDDVILTAKILQLGKIEPFFASLLDTPDPAAVKLSLDLLLRLEALDDDENLTPLGYHLARLPIRPQMGKMILFGAIFSCLDPVLSVAASLDFKDAFQLPMGHEKEADSKRLELDEGWKSDHLVLHKAIRGYETAANPGGFCWEFFLSSHNLKLLIDMKKQFMSYLYDLNFVSDLNPRNKMHNINSNNLSLVKAVICAGLFPNVAVVRNSKNGRAIGLSSMDFKRKYNLHPKSVLSSVKFFESPLVVYFEKMKSTSEFIFDASMVYPLPIVFFGDHFQSSMQDGKHLITIADSLKFSASESTIKVIGDLRDRMYSFLKHKITHPGVVDWTGQSEEVQILGAIIEVITVEDMKIFDLDGYFND